jgi:hypothetical protein
MSTNLIQKMRSVSPDYKVELHLLRFCGPENSHWDRRRLQLSLAEVVGNQRVYIHLDRDQALELVDKIRKAFD